MLMFRPSLQQPPRRHQFLCTRRRPGVAQRSEAKSGAKRSVLGPDQNASAANQVPTIMFALAALPTPSQPVATPRISRGNHVHPVAKRIRPVWDRPGGGGIKNPGLVNDYAVRLLRSIRSALAPNGSSSKAPATIVVGSGTGASTIMCP